MSDAKEIITLVMNDEKLKNSSSFTDRVYHDEPILRPASQLPRPDIPRKPDVPDKIRQMKELPYLSNLQWQSRERIFFEQAKFMEDYEDDLPYSGNFTMYYPTYGSMTAEQLRGYFTWRTSARKDGYGEAPLSFVFVYIYELLAGIGASSPEDGYDKLKRLASRYSGEPAVNSYLRLWIKDYVIYHRLSRELLDDSGDVVFDNALLTLMNCAESEDADLFSAITQLSSYNIERSTFFREYPDDLRAVTCSVYRKLSDHCSRHNKKTLCEKYFGRRIRTTYYMFRSAVFWDRLGRRSFDYEVDPLQRYECRNGMWFSDMVQGSRGKSRQLGELVRSVDHLMRLRYGFKHQLGGCTASKAETKIIEKEIGGIIELKKQQEAARIEIDVSKLSGIRSAADITRDKLIVDDGTETDDIAPDTGVIEESENVSCEDTPLDAAEYCFMQCLLYGGDAAAAAKEAGTMPSLLADSVNGKLFDIFGDTVIDISGGSMTIIDDYTDELKGMIKQ